MVAISQDRLAFTPNEAAALLGLPERSIRDLCARGEIKATKLGERWLIPRSEITRLAGANPAPHEAATDEREVDRLRRELSELREEVNRRVGRLLDEA